MYSKYFLEFSRRVTEQMNFEFFTSSKHSLEIKVRNPLITVKQLTKQKNNHCQTDISRLARF